MILKPLLGINLLNRKENLVQKTINIRIAEKYWVSSNLSNLLEMTELTNKIMQNFMLFFTSLPFAFTSYCESYFEKCGNVILLLFSVCTIFISLKHQDEENCIEWDWID